MVHLSYIDIILISLYFILVVLIGYRASRRGNKSAEEYFLAGRSLTLPIFVATLVSTWYGGILGVGEYTYSYGISNWFVFGVPYYFFALLFALLFAKKVRSSNLFTIPDKLEAMFDKKTALLGSILTFLLSSPAAYVLMLGILFHLIFGLNLVISIVITTALTIIYLFKGGFRAGVWANVFEFVLMYLGFGLMVFFSFFNYGGFDFLKSSLPHDHLTWHGGNSLQYILVWFFIALWTIVDPAFHQRCYAAKDTATAQRGIVVSVLFWFVFDSLTTVTGLYARATMPHLPEPLYSYPLLAEQTLPSSAKGLFFIGLLATIMSTLSSLSLISAITFGKDIVARWKNIPIDSIEVQQWTKIGLVVTALLSIILSILLPSVVKLWYTIGTCVIPGLLVPVISSYFEKLRISANYAFGAMSCGWFTSTFSLVWGYYRMTDSEPQYLFSIEPMYPGIVVSVIWLIIGKLNYQRKQLF